MLVNEHTVDCIWSDYGPWSKCSKTCGFGTQKRKRFFAVAAKGPNGKPCLGAPSEERSCNRKACITTTTRIPTTSTSLRTTDIDTSGTTFPPPQTTITFTENDLILENETTYPSITNSTHEFFPPTPQIKENIPILETTTSETEFSTQNTKTVSNLENIDSTQIPTSTDSTNTSQSNKSTAEPSNTISPLFLEKNSSDTFSSQNVSTLQHSFDTNENVLVDDRTLDTNEVQNRTLFISIETVEENEIQDVGLESNAKASINAIAFNDINAKQSEMELDVTSSIHHSSSLDKDTPLSKSQSKHDDISNSSIEMSNVVSDTNALSSNSNKLQTSNAPNLIDRLEDTIKEKTASSGVTKIEDLSSIQVGAKISPMVSLNGVGDVDSE